MDFSIEEVKETVDKSCTILTSFCDKNNILWISSSDVKKCCVDIYAYHDNNFLKKKNLTLQDDGYGKNVIFFEYCEETYVLVCSNYRLYYYNFENIDEICLKYDVENAIENVIENKFKFYIKSFGLLYVFDFDKKTKEKINIENIGLFDVNDSGEYLANYNNGKLQIYSNFDNHREYNLKNCEKIKFFGEKNLLTCEKNNIKIFDIFSEKNMYKSLYHSDDQILDVFINTCHSGRCYMSLRCEKNVYILEYYQNNFTLLKMIEIYKLFNFVAIFDKTGNYFVFVENLIEKHGEYNNDIEKAINTKLKFVEFCENNSNFDLYVDILFDEKNKSESEFAKLFSVYFEKLLEFLEREESNDEEKSLIKKLISNNLMVKKPFYDTRFTIYKQNKQIITVNNDKIYSENKEFEIKDKYDDIINNIYVMENYAYAMLKKNEKVIISPYLNEGGRLKINKNSIIKNNGENINLFYNGNFDLEKESIDLSNAKKYFSNAEKLLFTPKTFVKIEFNKKHNVNTIILGYGDSCCDFPKYNKKNNRFMIKVKNQNYFFNMETEDIQKIYIIMELKKDKIEEKDKKDFIEYVEKTGLFDEYYKTKLICEMKNGDLLEENIDFNPFDLNMVFYNKTNIDIDINIDAFAIEKIDFQLKKKTIFCSKILDKNTIKIFFFVTKKEYLENDVVKYYDELKY